MSEPCGVSFFFGWPVSNGARGEIEYVVADITDDRLQSPAGGKAGHYAAALLAVAPERDAYRRRWERSGQWTERADGRPPGGGGGRPTDERQ